MVRPENKEQEQERKKEEVSQQFTLQEMVFGNRRREARTSPINIDKFEELKGYLNDGEYMTIHRIPPHQNRYFRNALIGGGLGLGLGAVYRYRQPLLKLGQQAYNYGLDKFHNLFRSTNNSTAANDPNPHNW